ncbi:MAG TPA: hypothetical protein VFI33_11345 [Puia sp.]|nr:hypothetical protein [Puia sp.]
MAIVNNMFLQNASGSVGKQLVFKRYYDKTVVSKMPDMSKRVLSKKQMESNERMWMATKLAKAWYKIEEERIKARIRLKLPAHKSLFHALVKEYLDLHKHQTLDEMNRSYSGEFPKIENTGQTQDPNQNQSPDNA